MATPDHGLQRLARLVTQRRRELGLHKSEAAKQAGLSNTTYMRVENGLPVRDPTYAAIEQAFGWAAGACTAVIEGGTEAQVAGEVSRGVRVAPAATEDDVRKVVHNATIATLPTVPAGDMGRFTDEVVAALKKLGIVPGDGSDTSL